MSIVTDRPRPINTRAEECPVVAVGTEHRDRGEPIPARPALTAADLESIVRYGHTGDTAGPGRIRPRPFSPAQAEAEAVAIAERAAGLVAGRPNSTTYAFKCGAYESLYGELYQHYLDAAAEAERYRRGYYPFFSGELELPDAELASTES